MGFDSRWTEQFTDFFFFSTKDGREFFFPFVIFGFGLFGAFKGYLLPKSAYKPIILKSFFWFNVTGYATFVITIGIGVLLSLSTGQLFLIGLFDYAIYHLRMKRITKKMVALPVRLSVRVYAALQDPQKLMERCIQLAFLALFPGVFVILGPANLVMWSFFALFFGCFVLQSYLLMLHNRETAI